ncbi:hypothetical protein ACLOJK_011120 [Asimina triloba]
MRSRHGPWTPVTMLIRQEPKGEESTESSHKRDPLYKQGLRECASAIQSTHLNGVWEVSFDQGQGTRAKIVRQSYTSEANGLSQKLSLLMSGSLQQGFQWPVSFLGSVVLLTFGGRERKGGSFKDFGGRLLIFLYLAYARSPRDSRWAIVFAQIIVNRYSHSPVHKAIATKDYASLQRIISGLPRFCQPEEILTEEISMAEEEKADLIAAVIDRRDVPNRETPLHLAVKLGDLTATEMLMSAGADWSLHNKQGWSSIQEAICLREEAIAMAIVKYYQPTTWEKWCRRLPRLVATMRRMRDFYMEITFNFESSVIPFIQRIAPSDTYRIWKRGSNLRADMTLAGFDGFKIQRSDQTVLFLGDGSEDGKVSPGSLCIIVHRDKEVMNALDGAGAQPTEAEIKREVASMSKTNIFRPGVDVTQAVLLPQLTSWRRHEKTEMIGPWKTKVYDMHHVVVSVKSRRVPGAVADDEVFSSCNEEETQNEFEDMLTEEEKKQLEDAMKVDSAVMTDDGPDDVPDDGLVTIAHRHSSYDVREEQKDDKEEVLGGSNGHSHKKKWRLKNWARRSSKHEGSKIPQRSSFSVDEKVSDLLGDSPSGFQARPARHSVSAEIPITDEEQQQIAKNKVPKKSSASSQSGPKGKDLGPDSSEFRKGLRPVLWLAPAFPLQIDELLPMLDILSSKVKAIRRLRELLTTKLPPGTFPVKVAIPVVPTIRVIVTFTKFEDLNPPDEFCTPPSSPGHSHRSGRDGSNSWLHWMKHHRQGSPKNSGADNEDIPDPFMIPPGYKWITLEEKKKKIQAIKNRRKARGAC